MEACDWLKGLINEEVGRVVNLVNGDLMLVGASILVVLTLCMFY